MSTGKECERIQLTKLAACAGCGAKVGVGMLSQLLEGFPSRYDERLIVGYDKSDDGCIGKRCTTAFGTVKRQYSMCGNHWSCNKKRRFLYHSEIIIECVGRQVLADAFYIIKRKQQKYGTSL